MNNINEVNDNIVTYYEWIINVLQESRMKKVALFVNGVDYTNKDISDVYMVLEGDTYMSDYIGDEEGRIIQLHFDKVTIG